MSMSLEEKVDFLYSTVLSLAKKEKLLPADKEMMAESEITENDYNELVRQLRIFNASYECGNKVYYREFAWELKKLGYDASQVISILISRDQYVDLINDMESVPPEVSRKIDRTPRPRAHCAAAWYIDLKNKVKSRS